MIDFSAQAMPGRRERQKRERRDRIEAAARAVFAEKGYDAATSARCSRWCLRTRSTC
jgi:hypothetical protein